jgi:cell division protein FtsB
MRKTVAIVALSALLTALQWRLWVADGGVAHTSRLKAQAAVAASVRNASLEAEVQDLNSGKAAIESRARVAMGMIRPDETFYLVVE